MAPDSLQPLKTRGSLLDQLASQLQADGVDAKLATKVKPLVERLMDGLHTKTDRVVQNFVEVLLVARLNDPNAAPTGPLEVEFKVDLQDIARSANSALHTATATEIRRQLDALGYQGSQIELSTERVDDCDSVFITINLSVDVTQVVTPKALGRR